MKKLLLFLVCFVSIVIGLASCSEPNEPNGQNNSSDEITIYGNVIDRATGQSLYNVLIQEKNKVGGSTVTGNDGNYEFTLPLNGSSDGKYYLVASKDKYSSSEYELNMSNVDKNRRVKVDFQLVKESITYTGTVLDSKNQPIIDAKIKAKVSGAQKTEEYAWLYGEAIGSTVITDISGKYEIELSKPSSRDYGTQWQYVVYAEKDGYATSKHFVNQNEDDMGRTITLNFTMKTTEEQNNEDELKNNVRIYGKVTNQYGQPIANAQIKDWLHSHANYYGYNDDPYLYSTTQTNSNGEYEMLSPTYFYHKGMSNTYSDHYYHEYICEAEGYEASIMSIKTSDGDKGKSYNFDFILTK